MEMTLIKVICRQLQGIMPPHRNKRTCRRGRAAIYDHAEEEDEEEHNMEHIIQNLNITQQEAI